MTKVAGKVAFITAGGWASVSIRPLSSLAPVARSLLRENRARKIQRLGYYPSWLGSCAEGWGRTPIDFVPMTKTCDPEDTLGRDQLIDPPPRQWPATDIVPFHFNHPVTGKPIRIDNRRAREGTGDEQ